MPKTVAAKLVEIPEHGGGKHMHGVGGDSLNGITDELRKPTKINWIHYRHEEAAAFTAGAGAQLTGKMEVYAGSCGPGICISSHLPLFLSVLQKRQNDIDEE